MSQINEYLVTAKCENAFTAPSKVLWKCLLLQRAAKAQKCTCMGIYGKHTRKNG